MVSNSAPLLTSCLSPFHLFLKLMGTFSNYNLFPNLSAEAREPATLSPGGGLCFWEGYQQTGPSRGTLPTWVRCNLLLSVSCPCRVGMGLLQGARMLSALHELSYPGDPVLSQSPWSHGPLLSLGSPGSASLPWALAPSYSPQLTAVQYAALSLKRTLCSRPQPWIPGWLWFPPPTSSGPNVSKVRTGRRPAQVRHW